MYEIGREGLAFLEAVLTGMILYSSYTCIRKFRRIVKHNLLAIAAEDFIFWIAAAVYTFVQIYYTSDGSIRWNFVLGVALGVAFLFAGGRILKNRKEKMYIQKQKNSDKSVAKKKKKS